MKQLSKIMLSAVATVALAAPAFAWDFSASGSSSATYKRETIAHGYQAAKDDVNNAFTSSAGGVTASSSHTDGPNSATFSYTADWNGDAGNFDEYVSVSGTKKVGDWTASSGTTQHIQKDIGPGADDNAATAKPMAAGNSASISLTNGSITYVLGDAAHLSTAEKTVNGPMSGNVDAEARVDSFNGFSVGLAVGPGTLTVAYDESNGTATTVFGDQSVALACGANASGFGLNFAGDVGVDLSLTYASGSAAPSVDSCTDNNTGDKANASTMGLGVGVPIGGMSLAIDYESSASDSTQGGATGTGDKSETATSGFEVSFTLPVGDATAGVNVSSQASETKSAGTTVGKTDTSGTELWYTVPIGPVSLSIGYGSSAVTKGCATCTDANAHSASYDGQKAETMTTTQMGAEMSMSF